MAASQQIRHYLPGYVRHITERSHRKQFLLRLRGDADGMTRDVAEARQLFGEMGATGWDDYARSIEG